jgi:hypothetical protein
MVQNGNNLLRNLELWENSKWCFILNLCFHLTNKYLFRLFLNHANVKTGFFKSSLGKSYYG